MHDLAKKVVLITGAAGGIGFAAAKLFAEQGATVVGTDIESVVPGVCDLFVQADASDEQAVKDVVVRVVKEFGRIDVLINNCGVGANLDRKEERPIVCQTALDLNRDDFIRVMDINFLSAVWFVKHVAPHMPITDTSCIISASSIWSRGKLHHALPYAASKAALSVAVKNWAHQFAPIRSVGVVLGGIETEMLFSNPNGPREVAEQTLLRRAGTPVEVAETYLYAACCRFLTATEIVLDGGSSNR